MSLLRKYAVGAKVAVAMSLVGGLAMADSPELPVDQAMNQLTQGMGGAHQQLTEWLNLYTKTPETFGKVTRPGGGLNTVTISAAAPLLTLQETYELVSARYPKRSEANPNPDAWGKRGDVAVYFPGGVMVGEQRLHYLTGAQAERYIKKGSPLRGFVNVGMPVEGYGSAMLAKNVAMMNAQFAGQLFANSPVVKAAVAAIAADSASSDAVKQAAAQGELTNPELMAALIARGQQDPALMKALLTNHNEASKPIAFIVHGFGGNDKHHYQHKFLANKAARASKDQVVAAKAAGLIGSWWKQQSEKLAAGQNVRLFTANHCAGTYENADWTYHLEAQLKKDDPKLAKQVLNRMYALDLGAAANRSKGVHHRAFLGTVDNFGFLVSRSNAFANTTMVPGAGHMLNPLVHNNNPGEVHGKALPIYPFAMAFPHVAAELARDMGYDLPTREQRIQQQKDRFDVEAKQAKDAVSALRTDVPKQRRKWVPFMLAKATALGNVAVAEAQRSRADAVESWRVVHEELKQARSAGDTAQVKKLSRKVAKARKAARAARNETSWDTASIDLAPVWTAIRNAFHLPAYNEVGMGELTARQWINPYGTWEVSGSKMTVADARRLHRLAVAFGREHRTMMMNDIHYAQKGAGTLEEVLVAKYGKDAAPAKLAAAKAGLQQANLMMQGLLTRAYVGHQTETGAVPGIMPLENMVAVQRGYQAPHPQLLRGANNNPTRPATPQPRPRRGQN